MLLVSVISKQDCVLVFSPFAHVKLKNFDAFIIQKGYICLSDLSFLIKFVLYLRSCGTELMAPKGQNGIKLK
jgi:hypothetical protein